MEVHQKGNSRAPENIIYGKIFYIPLFSKAVTDTLGLKRLANFRSDPSEVSLRFAAHEN